MVYDASKDGIYFTAKDGLDSSNKDEEIVDTRVANISVDGSTDSHQVYRVLILLPICFTCVRTYRIKKYVILCFRIEEK